MRLDAPLASMDRALNAAARSAGAGIVRKRSANHMDGRPDSGLAVDVVVIGGGPAGASAARLLAAWGHSVLLLTRFEAGTPPLAESLPPSCRKVFEVVGVREAIEAAGFLTANGNTVCWGGGPPRTAAFGAGRVGHQVLRRDFDRLLLAEARRVGTVVRTDVTVREVVVRGGGSLVGEGDEGTRADWTDSPEAPRGANRGAPIVRVAGRDNRGGAVAAVARTVLDCSGRAGIVARRHRTRVQAGATTLALIGVWRRDEAWPCIAGGSNAADGARTVVEAYADGWAWSVPVSSGRRYVTVMVDPRTTETEHAGSLAARYAAELRKTRHLARMTGGATLEGRPWACDASQYGARRFGGPGFLLVGDAATFIDPLSSFGVKKAMASGWLAAVVTNTCLRQPARADLARRFYAEREREVWTSYRRQAAAFFGQVSSGELHPFWSDRADPVVVDAGAHRAGGGDAVAAFRRDPAVRDAFEALRRAPSIRLRPTRIARATTAPAVVGREIVPGASLSIPAGDAGTLDIRYLRGVDLTALVAMADRHSQVPDLYEAYRQGQPPVELADFLGALSVLLGKGLLRNEI